MNRHGEADTMTERTPGPWVVRKSGVQGGYIGIEGDFADYHDFGVVAVTSSHSLINSDEALANAEYIVTAVNSHDTLTAERDALLAQVNALRATLAEMDGLVEHAQQIVGATLPPDGMADKHAIEELILLLDGPDQRRIQGAARAALSGISTGRDDKKRIADLEAACLAAKALLEPTDDRTEMAWQLLDEAYHERKLFTGTVTDPIADENDGWRPIESAPTNGTPVDLWCRSPGISGGGMARVPDCWFSSGHWWRYDEQYGDDQCRTRVHNMTHWRPLPAPPNSTNTITDPIAAAVAVGHHASDCARHNLPALPAGACDCGADIPLEVEMRRHAEGGFGALTDLTLSLLFMGADEIARLRAAVAAENEGE